MESIAAGSVKDTVVFSPSTHVLPLLSFAVMDDIAELRAQHDPPLTSLGGQDRMTRLPGSRVSREAGSNFFRKKRDKGYHGKTVELIDQPNFVCSPKLEEEK